MLLRGRGRPPKWKTPQRPGETPEEYFLRLCAAEKAASQPPIRRKPGRPRVRPEGKDKFSYRPGAKPGRCNAKRKKHPGKLCMGWSMPNGRCRHHGGRGLHGGWHTGNRKILNGTPYFAKPKGE